jgi:Tol biopolymer transport system component/C-terminal processing protease CtpA/Prc
VNSNGGTARRLTITPGNDGDPKFSPDGKWLAFRSRRTGSDCIYIMPAEGGEARRITWGDSSDQPCCWLPDSSGIIFSSYRRLGSRDLWVVRAEGGEPWPITGGGYGIHEYEASISADGLHIAYVNKGSDPMRRRGYFGTSNSEVWVCDFDGTATSNHRRLTQSRSHNASPVFISNSELLLVTYENGRTGSDRIGRIVGMGIDGKPVQGWGTGARLDAGEIAVGGGKLAFSTGNYGGWQLHVGELTKRAVQKISMPEIKMGTDRRDAGVRVLTQTSADEFAVSPDGKKIAFIAGGDVFVMPADEDAVPAQVTDTLSEEKGLVWAPNSTHLIFGDALDGAILGADVSNLAAGTTLHARNKGQIISNLRMDPFGRVWGVVNEERLVIVKQNQGWGGMDGPDVAPPGFEGKFFGWGLGRGGYEFSPDGRWVVFTQPNPLYNSSVVVGDTHTGEITPISFLFHSATSAAFSADGKRVVFANNQEEDYDIWMIDLEPKAPEFKEDKLDNLFKKNESKDDKAKSEKKTPQTNIVFDGIRDRCRRITTLNGSESSPVALSDGKTYCFIANVEGQSNIWKLTIDPDKGPDLKQITQSRSSKADLTLSADEKTLWWRDSGTITSMPVSGGKTNSYRFRVELRRDAGELRRAAFDEARWVMGRYYYDRKHHGIDWQAMCDRYKPALESVSTGDEYSALMNELLGELNSSHQGYYGFDDRSDGLTESVGYLGVLFDSAELAQGRYKVVEVVNDGPLDLPEGVPAVPFYVTGLNSKPIAKGSNLSQLLMETNGKKTLVHLGGDPNFESSSPVAVKPISRGAEGQLWYQRWVEHQRELVDTYSKGRLGYVHIRAMNDSSLRDFKHHLGNNMLGKEGVVIDVRFNGGGRTAVDVLEILIKRPWLKRQYGDLPDVSENIYRSIALEKPSILMINESSFSNAEIMAEGFRRLNIGKIVGVDTAGGVIGTGSYSLIDGSRMRLPSTGAYTVDGENLENNGRKPDIFIENNPEELDQGIDRQTERAVKELLAQLDK